MDQWTKMRTDHYLIIVGMTSAVKRMDRKAAA